MTPFLHGPALQDLGALLAAPAGQQLLVDYAGGGLYRLAPGAP